MRRVFGTHSFTPTDVQDFVTFVDDSDATFQRTGNASRLERAQNLAEGVYGRPNPMRHYFYLRASQKGPVGAFKQKITVSPCQKTWCCLMNLILISCMGFLVDFRPKTAPE
jgi:hypothetical protein